MPLPADLNPRTWDIYVVGDRALAGGASHATIAGLAYDAGAKAYQLRDKSDATDEELLPEAREVAAIAKGRGAAFIVNDRIRLALLSGATGVHLGQTDADPREARRLLGDDAIVGLSTHSLDQFRRAAALARQPSSRLDYISYGPIFATKTKKDAEPVVGLNSLGKLIAQSPVPIVAIGGINASNLATVVAAGFDVVAVISAAMDPSPIEATRKTRELKRAYLAAKSGQVTA